MPRAPVSWASRTTAPAPSPNSTHVARSSQSRIRLKVSAPITSARLAAPLLEADFTRTSLYGELRDRCGVRLTGGRERIRAGVPTTAERVLLGIPDRTAAFEIDRTGEVGGRPVEWRQTVVRGDRFSMVTDLTRPHGMETTVTGGGTGRAR